mmetsp:Transcript_4041/g.7779  ORF Transcript_4041/g.7779 Transcript_4041/m.7779 type:complete len:367 (-) Transcript_4041:24-1124(-)
MASYQISEGDLLALLDLPLEELEAQIAENKVEEQTETGGSASVDYLSWCVDYLHLLRPDKSVQASTLWDLVDDMKDSFFSTAELRMPAASVAAIKELIQDKDEAFLRAFSQVVYQWQISHHQPKGRQDRQGRHDRQSELGDICGAKDDETKLGYNSIVGSAYTILLEKTWNQCFSVSPHAAKQLSTQELAEKKIDSDVNFVYGEVSFAFLPWLFSQHLQPGARGVFYDLGSGSGRAVIAAALCWDFRECVGVELLSSLHNAAAQAQQALSKLTPPCPAGYENTVDFVCQDLVSHDWSRADVVFVHWTTWSQLLRQQVTALAQDLQVGSLFVCVTFPLNSSLFACVRQARFTMEWGSPFVYVYRKTK